MTYQKLVCGQWIDITKEDAEANKFETRIVNKWEQEQPKQETQDELWDEIQNMVWDWIEGDISDEKYNNNKSNFILTRKQQ